MQRSGNQTALKVLSIINIVLAALILIGGVAVLAGGGLAFSYGYDYNIGAAGLGGLLAVAGGAILIVGVLWLLMGIFGVRAGNNNTKVTPVWVLSLILLILQAISLVSSLISVGFSSGSVGSIVGLALLLAVFILATKVRSERNAAVSQSIQ